MTKPEYESFPGQGAYLVVVKPAVPDSMEIGRRYDFKSSTVLIGNQKEADIFVPTSENRSYSVMLFYYPQRGWMFENQGALGSVLLNGSPSEERRLKDGDLLQVGESIFHFLEGIGIFSNLYAQLSRIANLDLLTEAFNQNYFGYILEEWMNLSSRMERPLALIMIDVDDFKRINTDYGHNGGDFILKHVAKRIFRRLRKGDIFCRSGGDELSLILPNTTKENALKVAEEIRQEIVREPFVYQEVPVAITLSIGVTEYKKGMTKTQFQQKADEFMYNAKHQGKNRVAG